MLADPSRATAEAALGATGFPLILLVGMGPRVPNTIEGRRHPRTTFQWLYNQGDPSGSLKPPVSAPVSGAILPWQ